MDMVMQYRLRSAPTVRLHDIDAVIRHRLGHGGGHLLGHPGYCRNGVVAGLVDIGVVALAQHQGMAVVERVDVHDGEGGGILAEPEARSLAPDDLAEDAACVM